MGTRIIPLEARVSAIAALPELPPLEERGRLRRAFRITQEELAQKMGVRRETVARWEIGARSPGPENYLAYCAFYASLAKLERNRDRSAS